jgi:hypothetical protein
MNEQRQLSPAQQQKKPILLEAYLSYASIPMQTELILPAVYPISAGRGYFLNLTLTSHSPTLAMSSENMVAKNRALMGLLAPIQVIRNDSTK